MLVSWKITEAEKTGDKKYAILIGLTPLDIADLIVQGIKKRMISGTGTENDGVIPANFSFHLTFGKDDEELSEIVKTKPPPPYEPPAPPPSPDPEPDDPPAPRA